MNGTAEFGAQTRIIGHPTVSAETSNASASHALSRCCASSAGWATADGTAIAGEDYTAASGTLIRRVQGILDFLRQTCVGSRWNHTASAFDPLTGSQSWVTANVFALSRNAPSGKPPATPRSRNNTSLRDEHRQNVHSNSDRLARPHREMEQA